jgi:predicted ATPase/class 3 adenylate cyclase
MDAEEKDVIKAVTTYLPQSVAEELLANPDLPDVRGRFLRGTAVFADISGFTAMSEKLSQMGKEGAEELTNILNRYFTHMLDIAFLYRGTQVKFGGDAMFLLFVGHHHAARAVRCALRMQGAMGRFRRVSTSRGVFRLEMSIGINTGDFFEASVGLPHEQLYYVLTGRAVNRLAEIEAAASAGEVFIGASTRRKLGGSVEVEQGKEGHYQVSRLYTRVGSVPPYQPDLDKLDKMEWEDVIDKLTCYLPKRLAARIRRNPERKWGEGEHRRVTVMFVNLLGVSEIIERHDREHANEIVHTLNNYFSMVQNMVKKYDGMVVGCDLNARGDKVLIIFGAPMAHEDDDERAVRCALEMKQQLADSGLPLQQRFGINSGYVFSGEVGSPLRKEYTVMGDHVNLAARLMGIAREGDILIGHSTFSKVENKFAIQAQEPVKVKGKSQPVAVYNVEGICDEAARRRHLRTGALVGRDKEVATLKETVKQALAGRGQVLAITGVAGIGKSSLVEELKVLWAERDGTIYSGDCQSYGANTPHLPWIDLLSAFFHLQEGDTLEQKREKIETVMSSLCPASKEWAAVIGNLLHVAIPESLLLKSLDPKLRRQRLFDVILELLQAQAEKKPMLLLFEDLHWADTASVEILNYVARNVGEYPFLVCLVYRPEQRIKLEAERQENFTKIAMEELTPESSLDMVRTVVKTKEIPQELSQMVTAKAQGNPFFIEELLRALTDVGHLVLDTATGEYHLAGDLSQAEVPDTIQGIIMARLDRMDEETKNVLRVASVVGRIFQYAVLKDVYPHSITNEELLHRLDELVRLDAIQIEREEPMPEYYFRQLLTQEVAYESLLFALRRELHHRVGEYLERQHTDRLEEYYELLFHHYSRTRDTWKTLDYSVKAGDKAKSMFANQEAINYYQEAVKLAGRVSGDADGLKSKAQENLGDVFELTGQYDQALASYKASQQWYESSRTGRRQKEERANVLEGLPPGILSDRERVKQVSILCHKRGVVYERKGHYDTAIKWLDKGLDKLGRGDRERARLYNARAGVLYRKGEHGQAQDWCRRALGIAQRTGNPDEIAHSYYLLGTLYTDLGNIDKAIKYRQRALGIYEETKDLPGQARVHNNLGVDYYYHGDWEKAKEYYHRSLEIREKIGDINGVATVSNNLGEVLSDQGRLDDAMKSFSRCLKTWERIGYALGVALSRSNLGRACTRQGDWQKSVEHLEKSRQIFEQLQSKAFLAEVHQRLADAYLGLGQLQKARGFCESSLALAAECNMPIAEGVSRRTLGQVYRASGEWSKAEESLNESQRILRKLGAHYELSQTLWQLALLYYEMGKNRVRERIEAKIGQPLEEAIATFVSLGVMFDETQVVQLGRSAKAS